MKSIRNQLIAAKLRVLMEITWSPSLKTVLLWNFALLLSIFDCCCCCVKTASWYSWYEREQAQNQFGRIQY